MSDLTPRQTQILRLIQNAISESGMPPTRAEIARTLGFKSPNAAEEHLRALQRKGVIDLIPGASRGIQLKDILREQLGLPLIGRVAGGRPILARGHNQRRPPIAPPIVPTRAALPVESTGHEHEERGNPAWRSGRRASYARGAQSSDRRRAPRERGDRQALSARGHHRMAPARERRFRTHSRRSEKRTHDDRRGGGRGASSR